MRPWPRSLFARTAILIAATLLMFTIFAWQAVIWTVIVPAAQLTVHLLTERANAAIVARQTGAALPPDTRFEDSAGPRTIPRIRGLAYTAYVDAIRQDLQISLNSPDVRISRLAPPSEIWVRLPDAPGRWLVMSWRLGGPRAPAAALLVLAAGALMVLFAAAFSARRLTAPLATLAAAAARIAEGDSVDVVTAAGPSEVRSLAVAFQSMSNRLTEVEEQRELMLGGISHDLRTPLARIRVAIELVETQDRALIDEMTASVDEIDRMVGQFLRYVRANYREPCTRASLDEVVRKTLATLGSADRIELYLHAGESQCFAVECVRHTVLNLVQNAFEYGREPVVIRTAVAAQAIELSVEDHGAGLSPAEWLEAVQPFHRVRSQPGASHSGLGLALVDRLVRTCGGSLTSARQEGAFRITARLPTSSD